MKTSTLISRSPFAYKGKSYDLSHLNSRSVVYTQAAKSGRPERTYHAILIFSIHCFTRGLTDREVPETGLLYREIGETRIFDFQRYTLSCQLPRIMESLMERKCYHTGNGNYFTVELLNEETGVKVEYEVFFDVSRSSTKGVVNVYVQSAYVRDEAHIGSKPHRKPISFHVILFNTLNHVRIKVPK